MQLDKQRWWGEKPDWPEVAEHCRLLAPHVLVMDIALCAARPGRLTELLNSQPALRILLLAFPLSEVEVRQAARAGVHGILGNCDSAELVRSVRALHRGESFFSDKVASLMAGEPETSSIEELAPVSLTPGEERVLSLVAQGMRDKRIAEALSVSPKTVRNRLFLLYRKLRVRNRTGAVPYATMEGLIQLDWGLSSITAADGSLIVTAAARRPEAPIGL